MEQRTRTRTAWVVGAVVTVVLAAVAAVAVQAATDADRETLAASRVDRTTTTTEAGSTPTSLGVAPTSTTTTTPATTPGGAGPPVTDAAGVLDPRDGLSLTGIGPVVVGMTVAEAQEAAGVPIGPLTGSAPDPPGTACTYVAAPPDDPIVLLMVTDGVVARIDVTDASPIATLSGITIGSTEQEVLDTYGYRIVVEPHHYDEAGKQLRYVADDDTHSLIFETHEGVVTAFRSGFTEQVGYPEGCS